MKMLLEYMNHMKMQEIFIWLWIIVMVERSIKRF